MTSQQPTCKTLERLEAVTAAFLEEKIEEVEKAQNIKIKDVDVGLIPDPRGASPAVIVSVSV